MDGNYAESTSPYKFPRSPLVVALLWSASYCHDSGNCVGRPNFLLINLMLCVVVLAGLLVMTSTQQKHPRPRLTPAKVESLPVPTGWTVGPGRRRARFRKPAQVAALAGVVHCTNVVWYLTAPASLHGGQTSTSAPILFVLLALAALFGGAQYLMCPLFVSCG